MLKLDVLCAITVSMVIILLASCDVENCTSTKSNKMVVKFLRQSNGARYDVYIDSLYAVGSDSIIRDTTNTATLYLDPAADSTNFRLRYIPYRIDSVFLDPPVNDELDSIAIRTLEPRVEQFTINYTRTQRLISVDCGVEQNFNNLNVDNSTTEIDIVNKSVDRFIKLNANISLF